MLFTLKKPPHFRLKQNIVFLTRSEQEILHQFKNDVLYTVITIDDKQFAVKLKENETDIIVTVYDEAVTKRDSENIKQYIENWFDLKRNLQPFYSMAENDPILRPIVEKYKGYRIVGIPNLFEAFTWAILGQQINVTFAYKLKKRLIETYGSTLRYNDVKLATFPTAKKIASLTVANLRQLQISQRKAEYIIGIAEKIANNTLTKEQLMQLDDQKLEQELINLRGVGTWTANYVMMRTFLRTTAFPYQDVGIKRAFKEQLRHTTYPTKEEMKKYVSNWQGWEAYAAFYLWRTLYADHS